MDLSRRCSPLNKPYYLGIDLGTSAVKAIARSPDGDTQKARQTYASQSPEGWTDAVKTLLSGLLPQLTGPVAAVAFCSQVGTYVIDGNQMLSWQSSAGKEELEEIRSRISCEEFIDAISMPHPELVSYPLPRLLYIQKHFGHDCQVLMPKELLIRELTGQTVTDLYSMRGIANLKTGQYAHSLLKKLDIRLALPPLKQPTDLAGFVSEAAQTAYGLPAGTPVYLGCNDFFAGLLGMGILDSGDAFDLSGTSEHVGFLSGQLTPQGFVSGPYFDGICTYGGTKASGSSCDLAIRNFGIEDLSLSILQTRKPPLFLPYLAGERAPIFDEEARGVYFGLDAGTDNAALAYATLEGVVFSLYHIADSMGLPTPNRLVCGGGSARNELMNRLRATLFGCKVVTVREQDTSALGACILAMAGSQAYPSLRHAVHGCVAYDNVFHPENAYRELLLKRFSVYRELYPNLRHSFHHFHSI